MTTSISSALERATRTLGDCARAVDAKQRGSPLTPLQSEQIIGFGIANEWAHWAHLLLSIRYSAQKRSTEDREYALKELTRFTFMWTAANALFARSAIIELLDSNARSRRSELERFRVLYQHCGLSPSDATQFTAVLHKLLRVPMKVRDFPWPSVNTPPTILEVIYFKYTVPREQRLGFGKKLLRAAESNNYADLDLPTLVYGTRNWNIHGALLAGSFRGPKARFHLWIDTVNKALASVLEGAAQALKNAV